MGGCKGENINILAVIPARGGSKGIPLKNIADLNGRPLIAYTIEAAKKSKVFDRIIVSTDDRKIEEISIRCKAEVIKIPKRLAQDISTTESVMLHILTWLRNNENYIPRIIYLLQPTSPLRDYKDIKNAYKKFIREKLDSLLSVTTNTVFIWKKCRGGFNPVNYNYLRRPHRQDMKHQFRENGAIYITKYNIFMKFKNRLGGKIGYYVLDESRSIDIDSQADLLVAREILNRRIK